MTDNIEAIRGLADSQPEFISAVPYDDRPRLPREHARIRSDDQSARLMTCNNSLNSPGVFFSQCRRYGYDIEEMSKAEDYVVVEDHEHATAHRG